MARKKFIPPLANKALLPSSNINAKAAAASKTTIATAASQDGDSSQMTNTSTTNDSSSPIASSSTTTTTTTANPLKRKFKPPAMLANKSASLLPTKVTVPTSNNSNTSTNGDDDDGGDVWSVMFCKTSNKKHKTYDDGILLVRKKRYILHDSSGKVVINKLVGKTLDDLREGHVIIIGTKECEMMNRIDLGEYTSGRVFLQQNSKVTKSIAPKKVQSFTKFKKHDSDSVQSAGLGVNNAKKTVVVPHGCHVLNAGHPEKDSNGKYMYPVYIDSSLSRVLRPHQVEGIQFMYDCIMGYKNDGYGCLLADEMGLGKTLQSIALIWTLLSRGPYFSPVLKKVIIVTNSSLVQNWSKELKKWLGNTESAKPLCCTAKAGKKGPEDTIEEFATGPHKVMIISYNLCTNYAHAIKKTKCDLLICDEGHKLKNSNNQIFKALKEVGTLRRIVLSGTPIQNDLAEFFCLADFLNPGILGDAIGFKSLFTDPINLSREPSATASQKQLGMQRFQQLTKIINSFVLRRTNDVLRAHLPPKFEFIVFCKMTDLQEKLYTKFLRSKSVSRLISANESTVQNALSCIQNLKKLLAHPNMIYKNLSNEEYEEGEDDTMDNFMEYWSDCIDCFPSDYSMEPLDPLLSAKIHILDQLLKEIKRCGDRIVIVSNFTSILNQIQVLLALRDYKHVRLDGSTASDKRMKIVDSFNNPNSDEFVFLLSSKAGGAGLNIIGANRLILFDPDWNPSNDEQAMARVWRDGQKKTVFIYRFVSTATIEEKIFQRQLVKTGLSKTVVDEKTTRAAFGKDMLKQLFIYQPDKFRCETFAEEAERMGDNIDQVEPIDTVLHKAINKSNLISFIKIKSETDDDRLRLDMETDNSTSTEEDGTIILDKDEGEEEYDFDSAQEVDESGEDDDSYVESDEEPAPKRRKK